MTRTDARNIARAIALNLSPDQISRLKAIEVNPKLHDSMLTIRVYMRNRTADEPVPHIFNAEEI